MLVASTCSLHVRSKTMSTDERNPSLQTCPTKALLLKTWQNAAEAYSKAVAELSQQIGILPKHEYQKLTHAADAARKRSMEAQASLEAHIAEHGCSRDIAA